MESGAATALLLGFLLGLKHATDADHVVAVSTIVSQYRNVWRGIWVGGSWGLGHTTPLLLLGTLILLFKEAVLDRYASIAPLFEFGVGVMLVFLGAQVFWNLRLGRVHMHQHAHDDDPHVHIHGTHEPDAEPRVETTHGFFQPGKPFFRWKSFAIGVMHGLAGSAAVMLLLLPTLSSFWVGLGYLVLFGVGTILSMASITVMLAVPFSLSRRSERLSTGVSGVAGLASLVFGAALMADIGLGTAFFPF